MSARRDKFYEENSLFSNTIFSLSQIKTFVEKKRKKGKNRKCIQVKIPFRVFWNFFPRKEVWLWKILCFRSEKIFELKVALLYLQIREWYGEGWETIMEMSCPSFHSNHLYIKTKTIHPDYRIIFNLETMMLEKTGKTILCSTTIALSFVGKLIYMLHKISKIIKKFFPSSFLHSYYILIFLLHLNKLEFILLQQKFSLWLFWVANFFWKKNCWKCLEFFERKTSCNYKFSSYNMKVFLSEI